MSVVVPLLLLAAVGYLSPANAKGALRSSHLLGPAVACMPAPPRQG